MACTNCWTVLPTTWISENSTESWMRCRVRNQTDRKPRRTFPRCRDRHICAQGAIFPRNVRITNGSKFRTCLNTADLVFRCPNNCGEYGAQHDLRLDNMEDLETYFDTTAASKDPSVFKYVHESNQKKSVKIDESTVVESNGAAKPKRPRS